MSKETPLTPRQQVLWRALIFGAPLLVFTMFIVYVVSDARDRDNSAIALGIISFVFATAFYGGVLADRKFGLTHELREKMSGPVGICAGIGIGNVLIKGFEQPSRILSSIMVGLLFMSVTPLLVMTLFLWRSGKKQTPQNES